MSFVGLWSYEKNRADRLERENRRLKQTVQYVQQGGILPPPGGPTNCTMMDGPVMFLNTHTRNHSMGGSW